MSSLFNNWESFVYPAAGFIGVVLAVWIIHFVLFKIINKISRKTRLPEGSLNKRCRHPAFWVMTAAGLRIGIPFIGMPDGISKVFFQVLFVVFVAAFAWLIVKCLYVLEDFLLARFDIEKKDNLRARKIYTQIRVLKRIAISVVSIIALGTILLNFPAVRQLGTTVLASAGVLGIIIGMAAQKTLGTLIAGIQIAITQPIRLDDVVIVENEWGRIEEITLTYVVVKIWDLRRLIVPITYFIENPFQNWTRVGADILGTVYLYVDHTVPVEEIRGQLQKIVNGSENWDKKVCVLQVTDTTERTVELRALMSAEDASKAWALRCEVREKLLGFLVDHFPHALPRYRAELEKSAMD